MKNSLLIVGLMLATVLNSCKDKTKPYTVQKSDIEITLPGYIDSDELADDAILEYANRYRNFYIAGFELDRSIALDSAQNQAAMRIANSLIDAKIQRNTDKDSLTKAIISGHFKDEPEEIIYQQKIIENPNKRYLLTVWIRGRERYEKYEDDVLGILNSFKTSKSIDSQD